MDIVLTFIKKYISLLIPAVIIVFALILLIPTMMVGNSIKAGMEDSSMQGKSIDSWLSRAHSNEDVAMIESYQNAQERDVAQVESLAKQTSQRELISYDIFPEPADTSVQIFSDYGVLYRQAIEDLFARINARCAPMEIEIKRELQRRGNTDLTSRSSAAFAGPSRVSRFGRSSRLAPGGGSDPQGLTIAITDAFLRKRAQEIPIYASPSLFDWYPFWEDYTFENNEQAVKDCWSSQVAFWIYEDVIETIKAVNEGSSSVFTSDVKRLIGIGFNKAVDYQLPRTSTSSISADDPMYVGISAGTSFYSSASQQSAPAPKSVLDVSAWTGRVCNEDIDVIHFSVGLVISSKAIFPFIKELCSVKEHKFKGYLTPQPPATYKRNQISVLQYWQEPVDTLGKDHEKYRYGDSALVKLTLTCEYAFNCAGYDEIKPQPIKDILNPPVRSSGLGGPGVPGYDDFF